MKDEIINKLNSLEKKIDSIQETNKLELQQALAVQAKASQVYFDQLFQKSQESINNIYKLSIENLHKANQNNNELTNNLKNELEIVISNVFDNMNVDFSKALEETSQNIINNSLKGFEDKFDSSFKIKIRDHEITMKKLDTYHSNIRKNLLEIEYQTRTIKRLNKKNNF
ncbi:MAG: hypothetical protein CMF62_00805 [Magnetococcales bacterium]|nr:hypothetical protein [Magnetococcales bacterium]|tara:strand:- start:1033 stop:1539 length:507 start_codon:yes stop_codon:yes gene_type:complete